MGKNNKSGKEVRVIMNPKAKARPRREHVLKDPMPAFARDIQRHPVYQDLQKLLKANPGRIAHDARYQSPVFKNMTWRQQLRGMFEKHLTLLSQGIHAVERLAKSKSRQTTVAAMRDFLQHRCQVEKAYLLVHVLEGLLEIEHLYFKWEAECARTHIDNPPSLPKLRKLERKLFGKHDWYSDGSASQEDLIPRAQQHLGRFEKSANRSHRKMNATRRN